MGKIVITTNITLDGVVQDPDGQEGCEFGGWFHQFIGPKDLAAWVSNETEEVLGAEALLLGRRTFEWFATRTPEMGERVSRKWADRMNSIPKYLVSSKPDHLQWNNTMVLEGDAVTQISELKRKVNGEILVYGSYQLVRTLMESNLADELRLVVFPVMLGIGVSIFDEISNKKPMHLVDTRKIGDSLVFSAYDFVQSRRL